MCESHYSATSFDIITLLIRLVMTLMIMMMIPNDGKTIQIKSSFRVSMIRIRSLDTEISRSRYSRYYYYWIDSIRYVASKRIHNTHIKYLSDSVSLYVPASQPKLFKVISNEVDIGVTSNFWILASEISISSLSWSLSYKLNLTINQSTTYQQVATRIRDTNYIDIVKNY